MTHPYKFIDAHHGKQILTTNRVVLAAVALTALVGVSCIVSLTWTPLQPPRLADSSHVDSFVPLSTNTPYAMSGSTLDRHAPDDKDWSSCSLVQINAVYRHGTRYPMRSDYTKMHNTLVELQNRYNDTLPSWLQTYTFAYPEEASELLAPPGQAELDGLGRRARALADRYNLTSTYTPDAFVFEHTHVLRTLQSAQSFAGAYFADKFPPPNVTYKCQPPGQDIPLRFFDNCPKYKAWVRDSTNMTVQTRAFEASSRAAAMIARLRDAVLPPTASMTWKQLKAMYSACACDVALFNQSHTWCSLFSTRDLLLLDYYSDLKKFYECGPGFDISVAIAAPLLADMLTTIKARHLTGYFRFAHAETVLPLACLLGLCTSKSPLVASWTDAEIDSRHFKVSLLSPFATNLAFHVYSCGDRHDVRIKLLANEVEVPLAFCQPKGHCTLDDLEGHFQTALRFDFTAECRL